MEVTAYYSDNTSAVVTNYTYSPSGLLPYGTTQVVISYTEGGITATATQAITVSIKTYDYTKSKVFSSPRNYSLADIGATHRNIRVVCIGGGTGGNLCGVIQGRYGVVDGELAVVFLHLCEACAQVGGRHFFDFLLFHSGVLTFRRSDWDRSRERRRTW